MDDSARSFVIPMASRTCDGSSEPDWQAEPAAAYTPSRSRSSSSDSASTRGNVRWQLPATATERSPVSVASGTAASSPAASRSRRAAIRATSSVRRAAVAARAAAIPTMPATLAVPDRRPRSCPPPSRIGWRCVRRRTTRAPTPVGPPNLWPDTETRSATRVVAATSTHGTACTASVCSTARGARSRTTSATRSSGCSVPTSLFTAITETTAVRPSSASASTSRSTTPSAVTPTSRRRNPSRARRSAGFSTAWCSTALTTRPSPCPAARAGRAAPCTARLSDSVPPLVNTTSPGSHPRCSATTSRAASSAVLEARRRGVDARGVAERPGAGRAPWRRRPRGATGSWPRGRGRRRRAPRARPRSGPPGRRARRGRSTGATWAGVYRWPRRGPPGLAPGAVRRLRRMSDPVPLGGGAAAGYSGTPLATKLGIKADMRVVLVDPPADLDGSLGALPDGVTVVRRLGAADVVLFFTTSRTALARRREALGEGDLPQRRRVGVLAEEGVEGPDRHDRGRRARGGAPARARRREGLRGRRRLVGPEGRLAHRAPHGGAVAARPGRRGRGGGRGGRRQAAVRRSGRRSRRAAGAGSRRSPARPPRGSGPRARRPRAARGCGRRSRRSAGGRSPSAGQRRDPRCSRSCRGP